VARDEKMTAYQDIRRQIEDLTLDEQLRLLEELAAVVRYRIAAKTKRNIMELEGLGKEVWRGLDAQKYVEQERASWKS
jgi:DNA-binding HxlR family transcriptional regulator